MAFDQHSYANSHDNNLQFVCNYLYSLFYIYIYNVLVQNIHPVLEEKKEN